MTLVLTIREELGLDRREELVEGGVPFAEGKVHDAGELRLRGPAGEPVALQSAVLERWPDGSLRWVSLAFLGEVAAQSEATYTLDADESAEGPPAPVSPVAATENEEGIRISTGAVELLVRGTPFDPLAGLPGLEGADLRVTRDDGRVFSAADAAGAELSILEAGPVVARVLARGSHGDGAGGSFLGFEVEVEAVAGSPEIAVAYRIVNREPGRATGIAGWELVLRLAGDASAATCGVFDAVHRTTEPFTIRRRGEGYSRGIFSVSELASGGDWADASDPMYGDRWEWAELCGRHASNWLSVELPGEALSVVVPHFADTHPSDLGFAGDRLSVGFWPADAGVLQLTQGMAPCGRLVVRAGSAHGDPPQRFAGRREVRLVPDPAGRPWETGAVPPLLAREPERFPHLESHVREELFSWYLGGQASGLLDRGDCFQVTTGPRAGFTANNEHDALLALCLHYLRSGERAYLESAEAYGDHLVDVDLIRFSDRNTFETGGLRAHGVGHVHYVPARTPAGPTETSIDTGHMWVEGLLLLAALTGRRRYRDAACAAGDCLLGLIDLGWARPEPGPRNSGWPLVALSALYRSTLDRRYLEGARRVARQALAAQGEDGRWTMRLGFHDGYCAWQNAVLLVGLARLLAIDDDPAVERGFRAGCEALLELGRYDDGGFVYLDRFDYRWVSRQAQIREALAAAHALTDDERFLVAGLEGGAAAWLRPRGQGPALSNDVAEWRGHLPFLHELDRAGLLRDLTSDELGSVA